ncbi:hypothetical protein [Paenibacillus sp. FSL L8-0499]|uniref:hypothetical protein n=1 Tax=Paenibacillus sp. FSL L8-0499 TaxID=2975334 RepID=UPI0030FBD5B6
MEGLTEVDVIAKVDGKDKSANRKPLPYIQAAKHEEGFSDSQKRFCDTFNNMRKRLLEIGEMQQR